MRNNKGQTLVAFMLILPFLAMLVGFLFDYGIISTKRRKMENVVKDSITYGLTHEEENLEEKLNLLLQKNIENIQNEEITIEENKIEITVTTKEKSTYSVFMGKYIYEIKVHYKGYLKEDNIQIIKE